MKNYILKVSILVFGFLTLIGCDEDNVIFDVNNGQTLAKFSGTSGTLATPEDGATTTVDVLVTTKSNTDRAIQIVIDPASTATADQYQISDLFIPAGAFLGTIKFTSNFNAIPETGSTFLIINLTGIEGADTVTENATLNIELFRKCPNPTGEYILELNDSYGDGWDGAFITVTIDGVSTDYTASGFGTTHIVNVPDGTEELIFSYTSGSFEGEHTYIITSPNGIIVKADGPGPTTGIINFNPCNI